MPSPRAVLARRAVLAVVAAWLCSASLAALPVRNGTVMLSDGAGMLQAEALSQTWVDNGGGLLQYHGNPDEKGDLRFLTDLQYATGQPRLPTRLTFFRVGPDEVRQLSEQSADGGTTWTVNYDFIYRRRPGTAAATPRASGR